VRHVQPLDVYHYNIVRQYAQSWVQLPNSAYLDEDEELDDEDDDDDELELELDELELEEEEDEDEDEDEELRT
jgi:hypothetical protein